MTIWKRTPITLFFMVGVLKGMIVCGFVSSVTKKYSTRTSPYPKSTIGSASWFLPRTVSAFSQNHHGTILYLSDSSSNAKDETSYQGIDTTLDDRLYRIRLPRATGIEWGSDLSFSFVYVRDMDPSGPASLSSMVSKGDQICELKPVVGEDTKGKADTGTSNVIPLIGASFDTVMRAFASLDSSVKDIDLVLFKGTKDDLKKLCSNSSSSDNRNSDGMIKITVIQNKGSREESTKIIMAKEGANIRQTLVDNGINVYQSITRWTNCKGKQLCGTCIVNIKQGSENTNRKSMDEESTLRENPESYRLSCVTFAYGDVTVETFPPIKASQWTR